MSYWGRDRKTGQDKSKTEERREARRQAGLERYRKAHPDPNENRKWTEPVKAEYERQESRSKGRGKCKGKTVFGTDCPANASPAGTGYCSTHESQGVQVGEIVSENTVKTCKDCNRNPAWAGESGEEGYPWCRECTAKRLKWAHDALRGRESLPPGWDDLDSIMGDGYERLLDKPKPLLTPEQLAAQKAAEKKRDEERLKKLMEQEAEYRKRAREGKPVSPLERMLDQEF